MNKFRVWDSKAKTMYEKDVMGIVIHLDGELNIVSDDGGCLKGTDTTKHLTLLKCANIEDENGKEIYEGDIVKRTSMAPGGTDMVGVVEYDECAFWLTDGIDAVPLFTEADIDQVIGNRYEDDFEKLRGETS